MPHVKTTDLPAWEVQTRLYQLAPGREITPRMRAILPAGAANHHVYLHTAGVSVIQYLGQHYALLPDRRITARPLDLPQQGDYYRLLHLENHRRWFAFTIRNHKTMLESPYKAWGDPHRLNYPQGPGVFDHIVCRSDPPRVLFKLPGNNADPRNPAHNFEAAYRDMNPTDSREVALSAALLDGYRLFKIDEPFDFLWHQIVPSGVPWPACQRRNKPGAQPEPLQEWRHTIQPDLLAITFGNDLRQPKGVPPELHFTYKAIPFQPFDYIWAQTDGRLHERLIATQTLTSRTFECAVDAHHKAHLLDVDGARHPLSVNAHSIDSHDAVFLLDVPWQATDATTSYYSRCRPQ